ncbi:MAG: FixH family protein [Bacteroidota bacterium]|jgi:nitrogen fixation protein FixH
MNWGKSIVLSFVVFASFIGTMAYKMATAKVDLVRTNYYQKEIEFQQQINRVHNSTALKSNKAMTYSPETQVLRIGFPATVSKGEVTFFRPSDKGLDFTIPIQKISLFNYSTEKLTKGYWKVQATWTDGIREYYLEDELTIK